VEANSPPSLKDKFWILRELPFCLMFTLLHRFWRPFKYPLKKLKLKSKKTDSVLQSSFISVFLMMLDLSTSLSGIVWDTAEKAYIRHHAVLIQVLCQFTYANYMFKSSVYHYACLIFFAYVRWSSKFFSQLFASRLTSNSLWQIRYHEYLNELDI
jgi:hypothetical protein